MAKAHVDDYNTRNAALIAHGALAPLEFPFQLSPVSYTHLTLPTIYSV